MNKALLLCIGIMLTVRVAGQSIDRAEYFVDVDPGVGNGYLVPVISAETLTDLSFEIPVASLSEGFHYVFFRVRDVKGSWSAAEYRTIYKTASFAGEPLADIVKAEYFIDSDPGAGAGTNIPITSSNILEPFSFELPIASLENGFHVLYIRVKDASGRWSASEQRIFLKEVITNPADAPIITRVEYFIDSDPGLGAATNVPITQGTSVPDQTFAIAVSSLPEGPHKLYVRAKNANDQWSLVHVEDISVCNFPKPTLNAPSSMTPFGFSISWSEVTGASGYRLDVSKDNFATFVSGYNNKFVSASSRSETVSGLSPGLAYQVRVRSVNTTCASVNSNVVAISTPLNTPILFNPDEITTTSFRVNWSPVANAEDYQLDVSKDNFGTFVNLYSGRVVNSTSETVSGLEGGVSYKYRVRASNSVSVSPNSLTGTVVTIPFSPVVLNAEEITSSSFMARWEPATGASNYKIDISSDGFQTYLQGFFDLTVIGDRVSVTGLSPASQYMYRVRAVNSSGISLNSTEMVVTTAGKANQTITFKPIDDKTIDDPAFLLDALSTSALPVIFSSSSEKISINEATATLFHPGRVTITASQPGNDAFNPAEPVIRSFCIKPVKPTITISNDNTETPILLSSSPTGNQWYRDGTAISGANESELMLDRVGNYTVKVSVDDCVSAVSDVFVIIITSLDDPQKTFSILHPNPATSLLHVDLRIYQTDPLSLRIASRHGQILYKQETSGGKIDHISIATLPDGMYFLVIEQSNIFHRFKFIKQ